MNETLALLKTAEEHLAAAEQALGQTDFAKLEEAKKTSDLFAERLSNARQEWEKKLKLVVTILTPLVKLTSFSLTVQERTIRFPECIKDGRAYHQGWAGLLDISDLWGIGSSWFKEFAELMLEEVEQKLEPLVSKTAKDCQEVHDLALKSIDLLQQLTSKAPE